MQNVLRIIFATAAAAAFAIGALVPASADVTYYSPPKFKSKVLPVYPESARAAHETGTVLVKVLVNANGKPQQFILFKSSGHKDLDDAVMAAVKKSTYVPAMRGTTAVVGFYDVTYKFTLSGIAQDEGSQSDLAKKLQSNPKDVNARIGLGTDYLNRKQYAQAEETFRSGTQSQPTNARMWAMLGLAYFQDAQASNNDEAKYKQAADAYDQALKLDPHVDTSNVAAATYFNYGFQLQQRNDTSAALPYAQKAIQLAPKEGQYYILLGEIQTSQGDYAAAVSTLKQAESLDNKKNSLVTARIIADLGNAEMSQGDKTDGMADLNRSEHINGQAPFAYEYLYSFYLRSGNRAAALSPLQQLAQLQPQNPQWQVAMGNIYLGQNNINAARQAFQKAQAIDPNSNDVRFGMAQLAAASGDTAAVSAAMAKITPAVSPKQASQYEAAIAISLINVSQGGKNYFADAQRYATKATQDDPNNGEGWFALGYAQAQQKDRDGATSSLKKAYALFKAANDQTNMKNVADLYKQVTGSDISS